MTRIHKKSTRGTADYGWLKANYSFSFADYFNPGRMGFRSMRVLNEDRIAPGGGFPSHGHQDMEILTYIISGSLEHVDSMGNRGVIQAGEFQMMSAGTGVTHSEANASQTEGVHLFQIWIEPDRYGLEPNYKQMSFDDVHDELRLVVAPVADPAKSLLRIHQNAHIFKGQLHAGVQLDHRVPNGRNLWLQLASGTLELNGHSLEPGDSAEIRKEQLLSFEAQTDAQFLLFDLA